MTQTQRHEEFAPSSRILLMSDSSLIGSKLGEALEEEGYSVTFCIKADCIKALKRISFNHHQKLTRALIGSWQLLVMIEGYALVNYPPHLNPYE